MNWPWMHRHRFVSLPWEYAQLPARWCRECHAIEFYWRDGWVDVGKRSMEEIAKAEAMRLEMAYQEWMLAHPEASELEKLAEITRMSGESLRWYR